MVQEMKMPVQFVCMTEEEMTYTGGGSLQSEIETASGIAIAGVTAGTILIFAGFTILGGIAELENWMPDMEWEYTYRLLHTGATQEDLRQAEEETRIRYKQQAKEQRIIGGVLSGLGVVLMVLPVAMFIGWRE